MAVTESRPGNRILVADDEPTLVYAVATALRYEGFDVLEADSGPAVLNVVGQEATGQVDLIVLDVMMPGFDGFEVVRWLRAAGRRVPVLFLTARDTTEDKVTGLRLGGDDYLTKPFSLEELLARVEALLRRSTWAGAERDTTEPGDEQTVLRFADLALDQNTHEVRRGGELVPLTATEFELLRRFLREPRKVLSKRDLLRSVWDYDFGGDPNVVETYISYLRKKLDRGRTPLVHTVRGAGYILREPPPEPVIR